MSVYQTSSNEQRDEALEAAVSAIRNGELIVLPTDTVYGIGADAFSAEAVQALLEAKGRDRTSPPPVLVGDHAVLMALAVDLPGYVEDLAEAFWPGPLTIVLQAQPSLTWDLGETRGTVALRMPAEDLALELLRRTGPMAVSSANRHGRAAATSVLDAAAQLGHSVEVYLDAGDSPGGVSSTIIDATVTPAVILREGAVSREEIVAAVGDIFTDREESEAAEPKAGESEAAEPKAGESEAAEPKAGESSERSADPADVSAGEAAAVGEPASAAEGSPAIPLPSEADGETPSAREAADG